MADKKVKATLELDASGVKQGAKQAEDAIKSVNKEFDKLGNKGSSGADKANEKINELKTTLDATQKIGRNLTTYLTLPLVGFGTMAVNTAKDFEFAMAEVSAIGNITGNDLKNLENQAKELGRTTFFSSKEAASGMKMYALAGFEVKEIMDAMPATLDLAVASNTDLARTCDIVSDAMTALKLPTSDTAKFTDILAQTSSKANTTVEMLGESFKYCAPVAGELGVKAEDLAVGLGLMANAGVKSTMSGTQMRTALSRLVKPTSEMQKVMDKYNIAIQKNEDGTVDLMATMKHLRKQLGELEATEKASVLATLMGQEAMAGWSAIIGASEEDFNSLTEAIYNSEGATKRMASVMGDSFEGKIRNMKSAFEGVQIVIGEKLMPVFEKVVDKITDACTWFTNLDDDTQGLIISIGGFLAILPPLMLAISGIAKACLSVKTGFAIITGAMGGVISASALVTGAIFALIGAFGALMLKIGSSSNMLTTLQHKFGIFGEVIGTLCESLYGGFQLAFGNAGILISTLGKMLLAVVKGDFKEAGQLWKDGMADIATNTSKAMSNMSGDTAIAIRSIRNMSQTELNTLNTTYSDTMTSISSVTSENMGQVAEELASQFEGMNYITLTNLRGTSDTMAMFLDGITEGMSKKDIAKVFEKNLQNMKRAGELETSAIEADMAEFANTIERNMASGSERVGQAGKSLFENFGNEATRGINSVAESIVQNISKMDADTYAVLQNAGDTWSQIFGNIANDGSMTTSQMKEAIINNFKALGMSGSNAMRQLESELSSTTANMSSTASNNLSGISSAVEIETSKASQKASTGGKNIVDAVDNSTKGVDKKIENNLKGASTSIEKSTNNLAKSADTNFSKVKKSADTNTKAMADSAKRNATNMYNGAKTSFSKMADSAISSTARMKDSVISNCSIMKNSAIRFWEEIRSAYSKSIKGEINITKTTTEKVNKVVSVEKEEKGKALFANLLDDDVINLTEKNNALKSLAIIKSTDRIEAEEDKKKVETVVNKNTKNITYNYSYTSPKEQSLLELRRKDRIQAQRLALSR